MSSFVYNKPVDTCGDGNGSAIRATHGVYWQSFPVPFSIDVIGEYNFAKNTPQEVHNAVMNCFMYVNDVMGFEFFKYVDNPTNAKLKVAFGPFSGSTLGRCSMNWSTSKKSYNRGTITLDSSSRKWFINPKQSCSGGGDYYDIGNTLTHEIGHSIGLAHNLGDTKSTMYNNANRGSTYRRTFSRGEVELLRNIYKMYVGYDYNPSPSPPPPEPPTPPVVIQKPSEGIILHGGWGGNQDPNTWEPVPMRDNPELFKVIDNVGKNIATNFTTKQIAQQYIDYFKMLEASK